MDRPLQLLYYWRMNVDKYPDLDQITLLAREYAPELLLSAVEIAQNSSNDSVRLKAIELVLNRGYGKAGAIASQSVPNKLDHMTPQERIKALEDAVLEEKLKLAQSQKLSKKKDEVGEA